MFHAESVTIETKGRGTYENTDRVQQAVRAAVLDRGHT